jgi:hypothetical protein
MAKCPPAFPRDAYGARIFVGDIVRAYRPREAPSTWLRKVEAIGDRHNEHLRGTIRVSGSIEWESAKHFEKVEQS